MIPIVELPLSIGDLSRVATNTLDLDVPNPELRHSQSTLTQTTFVPSNYSLNKQLQTGGSPNRSRPQIGGTSSRRMTMEFRGDQNQDQDQDYFYQFQQQQPPPSNRRWPVQASNEGTMASMKNGHWGHFRQGKKDPRSKQIPEGF